MEFRFQFRRYRLPFRAAVRTGHGAWAEREGIIVRLEANDAGRRGTGDGRRVTGDGRRGTVGFGEAAPVPGFGMESVDELADACAGIGEWVEEERLRDAGANLPTLRNAIASACAEMKGPVSRGDAEETDPLAAGSASSATPCETITALGVAALLPAGRAALELIAPRADAGFRVFKWKVGVGDVADEIALLDDVCAALPSGGKLRLDANGAWDRRKAERWLERCAERPVEFVEQPVFADRAAGEAARKKADDVLLGLAGDFPVKLALDESLVREGDVERWIGVGWRGVFVVKPALIGDLAGALEKLEKASADLVFSSALETAIGARAGLRVAFAWCTRKQPEDRSSGKPESRSADLPEGQTLGRSKERNPVLRPSDQPALQPKPSAPRALGFGVWPLFADARLDGPYAAPFIRTEDVERIDVDRVWGALG